MNIAKFLKTTTLKNICERLPLKTQLFTHTEFKDFNGSVSGATGAAMVIFEKYHLKIKDILEIKGYSILSAEKQLARGVL